MTEATFPAQKRHFALAETAIPADKLRLRRALTLTGETYATVSVELIEDLLPRTFLV